MIEEVETFCMIKRGIVISVVFFLTHLMAFASSNNCSWSTRNLELITECPVTFEGKEHAAYMKNCEALSMIQTCSKPFKFKYHCVASAKEGVFMEVCAPEVEIQYGYCATFNTQTGQLESHAVKQCVNATRPCPEIYVSSEAYLYPICYGSDDMNIYKEITTVSSPEDFDLSHPATIAVLCSIITFFLCIVITLCCINVRGRSKREEKQVEDVQLLQKITILLVGKTGSGKSSTGNTILGTNKFPAMLSACSVTNFCSKGQVEINGQTVIVIDTPGLFDTSTDNQNIQLIKMNKLIEPGPKAVIIVVAAGHLGVQDFQTLHRISHYFKDDLKNSVLLFTRRDDLEKACMSLEMYLNSTPKEMINLYSKVPYKIAFDNTCKGRQSENQVLELISMIKNFFEDNENP